MIKQFIIDMSRLKTTPASNSPSEASSLLSDPLDLVRRSSTVLVDSPHYAEPVPIPWIAGGHGFAEPLFAFRSTGGESVSVTTHETLGIYRLCRDLVRWRADSSSSPRGIRISDAHNWLFGRNLFVKHPLKSLDAKGMGDLFGWTKSGFLAFVEKQFGKEPVVGKGSWSNRAKVGELRRMVDSYQRGENLAFDLHGLLESSWLEEPLQLGWDEHTPPEVLEVAVARYHAACDLVAHGFTDGARSFSTLHPTLDIELAIRTLQLSTRAEHSYHSLLGALRAGTNNAEASFVRTTKAWENRFPAPYLLNTSSASDSKARVSLREGPEYEAGLLAYTHGMLLDSASPGQATFALSWRFVGSPAAREGGTRPTLNRLNRSPMNSGAGSQAWLAMATGGR